jgi:DNA-binding transcriptional MerR regulator/DNA-directed RNA polymerase subunit L
MNYFSIKDIEMLSGIKAHTFRIWEQRHGLSFCKRKESQHRYYDNEDLKAVLRIAYLYHKGYKISKIAHLTKEELIKLATNDIEECNHDLFIQQLIEATLDYDQPRFEKNIQNAILRFGFEKSILNVFYPFMQKVGLLWVTEHLIPAQEHFSSSLIQQKLLVAIDRLGSAVMNTKDTVVIFAPEGEFHEMPLLIAWYLLKKQGIKTVYFGVNVPLKHIEYYCDNKRPGYFFLHLITNLAGNDPTEYISRLAKKFPAIDIIASGPAISKDAVFPETVKILQAIEELVPSIKKHK